MGKGLTEHQLLVMRINYPGFKEKEATVRRVKADEQRYKQKPGYEPKEEAAHG